MERTYDSVGRAAVDTLDTNLYDSSLASKPETVRKGSETITKPIDQPDLTEAVAFIHQSLESILDEAGKTFLDEIANMNFGQLLNYFESNQKDLSQDKNKLRLFFSRIFENTRFFPQFKMIGGILTKQLEPEIHGLWLKEFKRLFAHEPNRAFLRNEVH